jgi:hypothetical protein
MSRAPGGGDDEYQELQKRFQSLESERKNLFEHTQVCRGALESACRAADSPVHVRVAARC